MTHDRIVYLWVSLFAFVLVAGCAGLDTGSSLRGPSPSGEGSIMLALQGDFVPGSTNFKIRLYKSPPASATADAYFESECTTPKGSFAVTDLEVGSDYTLVYDAYSSASCTPGTLLARGVRGNIDVTKEGTGNAVYYVQVNRIGQISAFPVPDDSLKNSGIQCSDSSECQTTRPCAVLGECRFPFMETCTADEQCTDGKKLLEYEVHPKAECLNGTCKLLTLFPLNSKFDRAFHVAASGPGGDVSMVGGFTRMLESSLMVGADAPGTETFGAGTSLFNSIDQAQEIGADVGLMGSSVLKNALGEQMLVLIGGTSSVGVEVDGDSTVPVLRPQACKDTAACPGALSSAGIVANLVTGRITRTTLEFSTAMALVESTAGDAGSSATEAFVRTGLVASGANIDGGSSAYRCVADEVGLLACTLLPGSVNSATRSGATSACVSMVGKACTEVVVLGGNTNPDAAFAELYSTATHDVGNLIPTSGVPRSLTDAVAVIAGGQVWTFGGTTVPDSNRADAEPYAFNVDSTLGTITAGKSGLSGSDLDRLRRTRHQATPLGDGKTVLITGGLDANLQPLASAVLVEASEGRLTVKAVLDDMAHPRVMHSAVRIQGGLMDGAVLITGGINLLKGSVKFASGAEIFVP
jgi:hypothetical protein